MEQPVINAKKTIFWIVALLIIVAPLIISKVIVYEYINPKLFTIELGLGLVIALTLLLAPLAIWKKGLRQPAGWGIGLFLVTLVGATCASMDPVTSWFGNIDRGTGTFFLLLLGIAAWAMGSLMKREEARKYLLLPLGISGAILALSIYAEELGWGVLKTADTGGFIGNTSMTGTYLLMTLFVTAYLLWSASSRRAKWLYGIAIAVMLINPVFVHFSFFTHDAGLFSVVGEARGAAFSVLFGLVIAGGVWGMTSAGQVKKWCGAVILGLAVLSAAIGIGALVTPNTTIHNWFVSKETDVRFIYWNAAVKGFQHYPVLGTGPETYGYTYQRYFDPIVMVPGQSGEIWSNKPHNMYLQVLTETGVVGTIGYLALFAGLIVSVIAAYRNDGKNDEQRKWVIMLSGLLAAYLLNNLIVFDTVTSYFAFFIIAAAIIARSPYSFEQVTESAQEKGLRIIAGLGVMVLVVWIVIPQIVKTHRAYEEFIIPLDRRAAYYQTVEDTASYGAALFVSQRADFSYEQIFSPNLASILQQNQGNKTIAANAIQSLIDTLQRSFTKYPPNVQGELAMGKLASIKMVILNAPDSASLATMKSGAEMAVSLAPNNPNGYMLLGQEYVYEQQYNNAYAQFEKARTLEPLWLAPHMALINLANLLHDDKKAAFYVVQAQQEVPGFTATKK